MIFESCLLLQAHLRNHIAPFALLQNNQQNIIKKQKHASESACYKNEKRETINNTELLTKACSTTQKYSFLLGKPGLKL